MSRSAPADTRRTITLTVLASEPDVLAAFVGEIVLGLSEDVDAFLVTAQRFEAVLQYVKRVPGDVEAAAEIAVALFDASPRLLFRAADPVETRPGADRGDLCPPVIALPARPTTEIEHDVNAQL